MKSPSKSSNPTWLVLMARITRVEPSETARTWGNRPDHSDGINMYQPWTTNIWWSQWLVGGFNPSEKYEFVSWGYYSQQMESHKSHVPNHQPVIDDISTSLVLLCFRNAKSMFPLVPEVDDGKKCAANPCFWQGRTMVSSRFFLYHLVMTNIAMENHHF